jgi:serine/threonine-protein kinase ULK/ATG1
MPKAVDIYVLETKIGSGQFGDVYRGYSKVDGQDVAVKTIRRDKIKGRSRPMQANSRNCWKTKYKSSRAAATTTWCG